MRRFLGLALVLALIPRASAVPDDPPKSPAEELKQLQKDVADAQKKMVDLRQQAQKTEDAEEKKKLNEEMKKASDDFLKVQREAQGKALAIAKADPKSEVGLDAALWAMPSLRTKPTELKDLIEVLIENHVANKKIGGVVAPLTMLGNSDPKAFDLIEIIATKNPNKPVQASALYAVADFYKNKSEPRGKTAPADADELAKKAELGFERIEKEFGDVIQFRDRTYGSAAKAALFELRHLRVGKTVPEVEGEDVEGAKFKLSDYRGKVVMLDFWGHW
jgi:hypothetical protein